MPFIGSKFYFDPGLGAKKLSILAVPVQFAILFLMALQLLVLCVGLDNLVIVIRVI